MEVRIQTALFPSEQFENKAGICLPSDAKRYVGTSARKLFLPNCAL